MNRNLTWPQALLFALGLVGCSDIETTPTQQPDPTPETSVGRELAAKGFGVDPYAIGSQWYNYDSTTHALTPKALVWQIRKGDQPLALIEILSYYNDKGDSGYFTLSIAKHDGAQWQRPKTLKLATNIKETHTCIDLDEASEVSCDTTGAELIARTISRVVPEAGFAVKNPALFIRTHPTDDPAERMAVTEIEASNIDSAIQSIDAQSNRRIQSVEGDLGTSRVGWIHQRPKAQPFHDIHLQVTTNLTLIQWQLLNITQTEQENTVELRWLCQKANVQQQPAFEGQAKTQSFTFPKDAAYSASLVQLCNAEAHNPALKTIEQSDQPYRQDWPSSAKFDWLVEQINGRISIRPAPGHLLWNWSLGTEQPNQDWQVIDVTTIWSDVP